MRHGGTNSSGYTILETMIFLAVSGVMFLISAVFVEGKVSHAQFRNAVIGFNAQVQQIINDVGNGYYPSKDNFICQVDDVGNAPTFAPPNGSDPTEQGTREGCVFAGKVLGFGNADSGLSNVETYSTYVLAGRQYKTTKASGIVSTSFEDSKPQVIYNGGSVNQNEIAGFGGGARIIKVLSAGTPITGVGFFTSFNSYNNPSPGSGGTQLNSGAQNVQVIPFAGNNSDPPNQSGGSFVDDLVSPLQSINGVMRSSAPGPSAGVVDKPNIVICLDSGYGQYATIIIGDGSGQRLLSNFQIYESIPAAC